MFGYIRPAQGELKVYELERFKSCYCGLCHALGRKYGPAARFTLSYELVFLAMLTWAPEERLCAKRGLCVASPLRKKRYCAGNAALDMCAAYNVILAWWKLRDTIEDEPFYKTLPHRMFSLALSGAYRKASREYPEFDGVVRQEVGELSAYSKQRRDSLDGAADKFARMLTAAVPETAPDQTRRPMVELLYHTGRWIYIVDAYDDLDGDMRAGRYNPVAARFRADAGALPADCAERIRTTLSHSNNLLCSAFELIPENIWSETVRNIIYLGMPDVRERVLEGKWPPRRRAESYVPGDMN